MGGAQGVGWGAGTSGGGTGKLAEGFVGWGWRELGCVLDLRVLSSCCLISWLWGRRPPSIAVGRRASLHNLTAFFSIRAAFSSLLVTWVLLTMGVRDETWLELTRLVWKANMLQFAFLTCF